MNTNNGIDKRTLLMTSLMAVPACQIQDQDNDWFPAVDLAETAQEYVFKVDLPGLAPEEIQLEVDSAAISISGKRVSRSEGGRWLRVERPSGAFIRQLPLPPNTTGEIFGSFGDGVLELRVPKVRHGSKTSPTPGVARQPEEVVPLMSSPVDLTLEIRSGNGSCTNGSLTRAPFDLATEAP